MPKSTKAEVELRIQAVIDLFLEHKDFAEIREHAQAQGWGVSDGQLWRYEVEARKRLARVRPASTVSCGLLEMIVSTFCKNLAWCEPISRLRQESNRGEKNLWKYLTPSGL